MTNDDHRQASREIRLRQYAALGELLVGFLPEVGGQQGMPTTQLPPRFECEAAQGVRIKFGLCPPFERA
ncbi:hypothetical protein KUC_3615 [Vreelandella boliviensis LC1]|uniref:Uncharacterized protein n=1 Tax=Vreelandella boliviensis LC1 TaxID=1072583 RepID=A0A7U9GEB1_9GAMM|nr:hypothetical protein [Halomonas boliviensis]EHJ91172.1 hypothetical protein KUC_3615 [Halomonas boliviensis LC1]